MASLEGTLHQSFTITLYFPKKSEGRHVLSQWWPYVTGGGGGRGEGIINFCLKVWFSTLPYIICWLHPLDQVQPKQTENALTATCTCADLQRKVCVPSRSSSGRYKTDILLHTSCSRFLSGLSRTKLSQPLIVLSSMSTRWCTNSCQPHARDSISVRRNENNANPADKCRA